jgi:SIR2-like domain
MSVQIRKPVLLTGAGFTANFQGFLAKDMRFRIMGNTKLQARSKIVHLLQSKHSFEAVYNDVINGDYDAEDKATLDEAVQTTYKDLDCVVRENPYSSPQRRCPINIHAVGTLLERFASEAKARGYIFTLNQDLLVERWYLGQNNLLDTPAMRPLSLNPRYRCLDPTDYLSVPAAEHVDTMRRQHEDKNPLRCLYYIKLHGSMNWQREVGNRKMMVIGGDKLTQIRNEPLLNWYYEIFKRVLSCQNRRLLVVGYGFGDPHINKVIRKAVDEHGLRLYVVSPHEPKDFRKWGIIGYCNKLLEEIYPSGNSYGSTPYAREIQQIIFESES